MSEVRDPIEYLLNRMEAARDATPPTKDYPAAREAVVNHVRALREMNHALDRDARAARLCRDAAEVNAEALRRERDLYKAAVTLYEPGAPR